MVKKQAEEAQKNISGEPGGDVKSESVKKENETTNKNSVGPENVAQGYSQKPSSDPSEPVASAKSAHDLGYEILNIIRKQAEEAQKNISGEPGGDVKSESVKDEHENVDKNSVKPENNKQTTSQKDSTDSSEPVAEAKKAAIQEMAAKVASYELGRQFCEALLKSAAEENHQQSYDLDMIKAAGRRDFDLMIAQAAENLNAEALQEEQSVKEAEYVGAQDFDSIYKQAQESVLIEENLQLKTKLAEYENFMAEAQEAYQQEELEKAAAANHAMLAENVANTVLDKLKNTPVVE
jgi:hypothetical protein